jgi:hypothetical protein
MELPLVCLTAVSSHPPSGCTASAPPSAGTSSPAARFVVPSRTSPPRAAPPPQSFGLGIHSRGAAIPLHSPPCLLENVTSPDAVHQSMKAPLRSPLGGHPQPSPECSHVVSGWAYPQEGVGSGPAGHVLAPHFTPAPPPQGPFPPAAFTAFYGTTIPSDSRCAAFPFAFGL